jgi:nitrogen regulatory protein PII-like uncharacterized protein
MNQAIKKLKENRIMIADLQAENRSIKEEIIRYCMDNNRYDLIQINMDRIKYIHS